MMGPPTWYVPIRSWPGEPSCAAVAAGCRSLWPWEAAVGLRAAALLVALQLLTQRLSFALLAVAPIGLPPAQWPPGGGGTRPPRGRAAARTRPRCAALTRRRATCPSRLWRLSAWIRRERRRTVEPQLRARKVVCTPTFDSAAGSGEIPAFFGVSDHI